MGPPSGLFVVVLCNRYSPPAIGVGRFRAIYFKRGNKNPLHKKGIKRSLLSRQAGARVATPGFSRNRDLTTGMRYDIGSFTREEVL